VLATLTKNIRETTLSDSLTRGSPLVGAVTASPEGVPLFVSGGVKTGEIGRFEYQVLRLRVPVIGNDFRGSMELWGFEGTGSALMKQP